MRWYRTGVAPRVLLDARSFRVRHAESPEWSTLENVKLLDGESGLLVWGDNSGRAVLFNAILGEANVRYPHIITDGEILTTASREKGNRSAVLMTRNPEVQLSACFRSPVLELAIPLALSGMTASAQNISADFMLRTFGLVTAAHMPVGTLSTGQKQRLLLASSLFACSSLLLVDGPMEFIDPLMRRRLLAFTLQFCRAKGIACLFAAANERLVDSKAFDRVFRIAATDPGRRAIANPVEKGVGSVGLARQDALVVEGLEYVVPGSGLRLYGGISFSVRSAAGAVLCGPNGAGKSTLAHIIAGRLSPSAGRVLVNGLVASESFRRNQPLLSLAFADPDLTITKRSVRDEIEAVAHGHMPECMYAIVLTLLGIDSRYDANPFDLNWNTRRRLSVAKAIKAAKSILFIDEPPVDATVEERRALAAALHLCVRSGLAVIVATNDADLAESIGFDHIVHLPSHDAVAEFPNKAPHEAEVVRLCQDIGGAEQPEDARHTYEGGAAWVRAADGWLERTAEFSMVWDRYVYPRLLPILAGLSIDNPCVLVDLGCGHGLHTAVVSRFLEWRGVHISSVIGIDAQKRFLRSAATVFGTFQNLEFMNLDLTNMAAIEELGQRLKSSGIDAIFTAFFSLHDFSSLKAIARLLELTQEIGGAFIAVLLSPECVRSSDAVQERTLAEEVPQVIGNDGGHVDWEWVGWYPVSVDTRHKLLIPYFLRDLKVYEDLLHQYWPTVKQVVYGASTDSDISTSCIQDDEECRQDEIAIVWTDYRPPVI